MGCHKRYIIIKEGINEAYLASVDWDQLTHFLSSVDPKITWGLFHRKMIKNVNPQSEYVDDVSPMILASRASAEDNTLCKEAMHGPCAEEYQLDSKVELYTLESKINSW